METTEGSISAGTAAIIVYNKGLERNPSHEFYQWLEDEGFQIWKNSKGFYQHVCWIYVNINSKLFTRGMPGINVTAHLGSHAVTIDEFKTIYGIFQKYGGKSLLEFDTTDEIGEIAPEYQHYPQDGGDIVHDYPFDFSNEGIVDGSLEQQATKTAVHERYK